MLKGSLEGSSRHETSMPKIGSRLCDTIHLVELLNYGIPDDYEPRTSGMGAKSYLLREVPFFDPGRDCHIGHIWFH